MISHFTTATSLNNVNSDIQMKGEDTPEHTTVTPEEEDLQNIQKLLFDRILNKITDDEEGGITSDN